MTHRKCTFAHWTLQEYDDLVEGVQDWVQKLMDPVLDDVAIGTEEVLSHARHRPSDAMRFKKTLRQYPDLVHASMLPETDEDILVGVILRYLHDNIFQRILYGSIQHYTEIISFVENLLQTTVEPKRGKSVPWSSWLKQTLTATCRSLLGSHMDRGGIQCTTQRTSIQVCP